MSRPSIDKLRIVSPGTPILASDHNTIRELLGQELKGRGLTQDGVGTTFKSRYQLLSGWCYLTGSYTPPRPGRDDRGSNPQLPTGSLKLLIGRYAYWDVIEEKWQTFGPEVIAPPQPGFKAKDFESFFLDQDEEDPQPIETDRAIALVANHFVMPGGDTTDVGLYYITGMSGSDLMGIRTNDLDGDVLVAPPAAGYSVEYWEFDIVDVGSITSKDRFSLFLDGVFIPDRRMKLATPAQASEFCEPCQPGDGEVISSFRQSKLDHAPNVLRDGECRGCGESSP